MRFGRIEINIKLGTIKKLWKVAKSLSNRENKMTDLKKNKKNLKPATFSGGVF